MIELAVAIGLGIILAPLILYAVAMLLVGAAYVVLVVLAPLGFLGLFIIAFNQPLRFFKRQPPPLAPFEHMPYGPERDKAREE